MAGVRVSVTLLAALALGSQAASPGTSGRAHNTGQPWIADQGDGTYRNPVLHADYSDPDVVRVGADYYLVSSSFNAAPGLPILHSRDLVNWTIVSHALARQVPEDVFSVPQHGKGVWAPCLRFHQGTFRLYYPDPDFGIYLTTARDPAVPWSPPVLVKGGKGLIDPSPLFDDDGQVYLVHAWAKSRSGINNVLTLLRLSPDGTRAVGESQVIVDGNKLPGYSTLEGPKPYKRAGYYYIFAPAGGVKTGWQSVFRSRRIDGPYEDRIVLEQGRTAINGPHQAPGWTLRAAKTVFLHFQDKEALRPRRAPATFDLAQRWLAGDGDRSGRQRAGRAHAHVAEAGCRGDTSRRGAANLRRVRRETARPAMAVAGEPPSWLDVARCASRRAPPLFPDPRPRTEPLADRPPALAEIAGAKVRGHDLGLARRGRGRRAGRSPRVGP